MREKLYEILVRLGFLQARGIYYIGGSDVLPPPLKGEQEQQALEALEQGSEEAKQKLIEHNLPHAEELAEFLPRVTIVHGNGTQHELLIEEGIVKNIRDGIRILGGGELTKKLTVQAMGFSKTAEEKIIAAVQSGIKALYGVDVPAEQVQLQKTMTCSQEVLFSLHYQKLRLFMDS